MCSRHDDVSELTQPILPADDPPVVLTNGYAPNHLPAVPLAGTNHQTPTRVDGTPRLAAADIDQLSTPTNSPSVRKFQKSALPRANGTQQRPLVGSSRAKIRSKGNNNINNQVASSNNKSAITAIGSAADMEHRLEL